MIELILMKPFLVHGVSSARSWANKVKIERTLLSSNAISSAYCTMSPILPGKGDFGFYPGWWWMMYNARVWAGLFLKATRKRQSHILSYTILIFLFPNSSHPLSLPRSLFFSLLFFGVLELDLLFPLGCLELHEMRYISQKERKKQHAKESCWKFIWIFWEPTVCIWKEVSLFGEDTLPLKFYGVSTHKKFLGSHFLFVCWLDVIGRNPRLCLLTEPIKERERCTPVPWTLAHWCKLIRSNIHRGVVLSEELEADS